MATKTTKLTKTQQMAADAKANAKTVTPVAAVKKAPKVTPADYPSFKVEVTILNHWKSQTPGVVYAPHTFAAFCTAKDEAKAEGKILRNFGLAQRSEVDYTVKVTSAPMPVTAS